MPGQFPGFYPDRDRLSARTISTLQRTLDVWKRLAEQLYARIVESHTIASGEITVTETFVPTIYHLTIDTQSAASTDELDSINGTKGGDRVIVQITDASRKVKATEAGNLRIGSAISFFWLNNPQDKMEFVNADGTNLDCLSARNN